MLLHSHPVPTLSFRGSCAHVTPKKVDTFSGTCSSTSTSVAEASMVILLLLVVGTENKDSVQQAGALFSRRLPWWLPCSQICTPLSTVEHVSSLSVTSVNAADYLLDNNNRVEVCSIYQHPSTADGNRGIGTRTRGWLEEPENRNASSHEQGHRVWPTTC